MESSIKVKLLSSGRYAWEINIIFNEQAGDQVLSVTEKAKQIDRQLKAEFPNHVMMGGGKAVNIDEE